MPRRAGAMAESDDPILHKLKDYLKSGRPCSRLSPMCSVIEKMFFLPVIACAQLA